MHLQSVFNVAILVGVGAFILETISVEHRFLLVSVLLYWRLYQLSIHSSSCSCFYTGDYISCTSILVGVAAFILEIISVAHPFLLV